MSEVLNNLWVINEEFPRFFSNKNDFKHLYSAIIETKATVVFVDSLTRMAYGVIEDSTYCRNLGIILRDINNDCNTTMIVIHHTPKLKGGPIDIDSVAGSRILSQEADFMIGVNKTIGGVRYIKDVAFRYAQEKEEVLEFRINNNLWIEPVKWTSEQSILKLEDGRVNDSTKNLIVYFIDSSEEKVVTFSELMKEFVDTKTICKTTLNVNLNSLLQQGRVKKPEKGKYSV